MNLSVNPEYSYSQVFPTLASEIVHSRLHAKGYNANYNRNESELDAQSVSYILCRRFGIECDLPDMSRLAELYEGYNPQQRKQALDHIQDMSKQIGGAIERSITPQQRNRMPVLRGNIR